MKINEKRNTRKWTLQKTVLFYKKNNIIQNSLHLKSTKFHLCQCLVFWVLGCFTQICKPQSSSKHLHNVSRSDTVTYSFITGGGLSITSAYLFSPKSFLQSSPNISSRRLFTSFFFYSLILCIILCSTDGQKLLRLCTFQCFSSHCYP